MERSTQTMPISPLQSHTAEMARQPNEQRQPWAIAQNGEIKGMMRDVKSHEETLALPKIPALGNRRTEAGKISPSKVGL